MQIHSEKVFEHFFFPLSKLLRMKGLRKALTVYCRVFISADVKNGWWVYIKNSGSYIFPVVTFPFLLLHLHRRKGLKWCILLHFFLQWINPWPTTRRKTAQLYGNEFDSPYMTACCSLDFFLIGINKAFGLSKQTELALKLSFNFIALFRRD